MPQFRMKVQLKVKVIKIVIYIQALIVHIVLMQNILTLNQILAMNAYPFVELVAALINVIYALMQISIPHYALLAIFNV